MNERETHNYKTYSELKNMIIEEDVGFTGVKKLKRIAIGEMESERITAVEILADVLYESLGNGKLPLHGDFAYGLRIIAQHVGEAGLCDYGPFGIEVIRPLAEEYNKRVPFVNRFNEIHSFNAAVAGETEPDYRIVQIFETGGK
ncbi:MAG: hypothetical protein KAT77_00845 [Nanoarchaeota archaeon]|nr:hypothetical protein [Nanoarchaeota archaeon]